MSDTPRPKRTHEDCKQPQEIGWVKGARKLVWILIPTVVVALGSGIAVLVTVIAQNAELRAEVSHQAIDLREAKATDQRLEAADQRLERVSSAASERVAVELARLGGEVRALGQQIERREVAQPRRR